MQISTFALFMLIIVTLFSSFAFVNMTSELTEKTLGRPAYLLSRIFWAVLPVIVQLVLILTCFHPVPYIVILAIITVLEWITIRRPTVDRPEGLANENPVLRFISWLYLSILWPVAGLFVSATVADGAWKIGASNILLYILAPLVVIGVGVIRLLLCGPNPPVETDDKDETDEAVGDEPADSEIDNEFDEPELNELDEIS